MWKLDEIRSFVSGRDRQLLIALGFAILLLLGTALLSWAFFIPSAPPPHPPPPLIPSPVGTLPTVAHAGQQQHHRKTAATPPPPPTVLALSTASFTAPPTGFNFPPPIPPIGKFSTFTVQDWLTVDPECPLYDQTALDYPRCLNWRNVTDGVTFQKCVREACTNILANGDAVNAGRVEWPLVAPRYQPISPGIYSYMNFTAPWNGTRKLVHMFSDFIRLSGPLSTSPTPSPPAQPLRTGYMLVTENTPTASYTSSLWHGLRELLVFQWNRAALKHRLMNPSPDYDSVPVDVDRLVFTPGRCFDMALGNIGWLQYNTVTVRDFAGLMEVWSGFNTSWSPHFDPITSSSYIISAALGGANVTYFEELCRTSAYPFAPTIPWAPLNIQWFCDLFLRPPVYYQWDVFQNYARVPSPWPDFAVMAAAFNREYQHAGAPLGCLGLPP